MEIDCTGCTRLSQWMRCGCDDGCDDGCVVVEIWLVMYSYIYIYMYIQTICVRATRALDFLTRISDHKTKDWFVRVWKCKERFQVMSWRLFLVCGNEFYGIWITECPKNETKQMKSRNGIANKWGETGNEGSHMYGSYALHVEMIYGAYIRTMHDPRKCKTIYIYI